MRRRLLIAILSVATIAVVLFGVPLAFVVTRLVDQESNLRLQRQAVLATRQVPNDFAAQPGDPIELPVGTDGVVFALYDRSGGLVVGSGPPSADETTRRALSNLVADAEIGESRVVAVPVTSDEAVVGAIRAVQSTSTSDARARRIIVLLAALMAGVLSIGAVIAYVLANRLVRPVRRLRDAAVRLGDGDFSVVVPHSGVDELDQAGQAMTATARRLDDLVARERAFSADASHQLRTPLAGLRANIETELQFPRADHSDVLREALSDIDRLEQTISELLSLARHAGPPSGAIDLSSVVSAVGSEWSPRFTSVGRSLTTVDLGGVPMVWATESVVRHVLDILLDNARTHGAGTVTVDCRATSEHVTLSVSDEGGGFESATVDSEHQEPDHGFGLPLARRLVESLPGRLVFATSQSPPRIEIVLKRADSESKLTAD